MRRSDQVRIRIVIEGLVILLLPNLLLLDLSDEMGLSSMESLILRGVVSGALGSAWVWVTNVGRRWDDSNEDKGAEQ
jgi:hypothetical protein